MRLSRARAQSIGTVRYFLALVVGAFGFWLVSLIADPMLSGARDTTNSTTAHQGSNWLEAGVNFLPIAFLLIGFFGIVALAIFQRERLR